MYGDTAVIRRRVTQLQEQAVDLRTMGDALVGQAETLAWDGRAADAMRERVRDRAAHLHEAAHRHDDAAEALSRHLTAVDRAQEQIAEAERRITSRIADARGRMAAAESASEAQGVWIQADPEDVALCSMQLPPSGHRDWLDLEIPTAPPPDAADRPSRPDHPQEL